ncbi:MAG: hypothetical protein M1831_004229 [Alyxoria varia]|nr:MAG: hypothetical protein M1831_004229 [Alyxoria varia]
MAQQNDTSAEDTRKHVVIIGGGAAGMSCASTLSNHPQKFRITLLERNSYIGGQATSIGVDPSRHGGATWMNDGVQGGSPAFKHTGEFFRRYGHDWHEVRLQVAFGKGEENFWTNVFPSALIDKYKGDIKKFGRVLNVIKYTMPVLGLVPIRIMLRMFFFSKDFGDKMVYPLIALFLGTGNQTANVACAILERLFHDPNMKLWDYSEETLLPNLPTMCTFPKLSDFYADWEADLREKGVDIRTNTDVKRVVSRDAKNGVQIETRRYDGSMNDNAKQFAPQVIHDSKGGFPDGADATTLEHYDDMVLCVLADQALKVLDKSATWRERFVLGGAKFFDDITITHWDTPYFQKVYETSYKDELAVKTPTEQLDKAQRGQLAFAKEEVETNEEGDIPSGFRPMYYTHSYADDPKKIEMSFDVTNYQHQFRVDPTTGHDPGKPPPPSESNEHIYQSIFLDATPPNPQKRWTFSEIDPEKVIESKWWHQLGHRWQHYVRVVPGMMWINSPKKNRTLYAGSWTLVNMHELACVSGIAAAWRLGARYEGIEENDGGFAEDFFARYLNLCHGVRYTGNKGRGEDAAVESNGVSKGVSNGNGAAKKTKRV